jgi:hypothetical protein
MKKVVLFMFLAWLAACGPGGQTSQEKLAADSVYATAPEEAAPSQPEPASETLIVPCQQFGPVKVGGTHDALVQQFGQANVSLDTLYLEGNPEGMQTTIWKGTPREIVVIWVATNPPYTQMGTLSASHPESPYRFANGIGVGTSLAKIAELNGKPFKFFGFGWDYGGTFVGFDEGKLAAELPCFGGYFAPEQEDKFYEQPGHEAATGDRELLSDLPFFRANPVRLKSLWMNLPEPQGQ